MASSWGLSWLRSWGNSWGASDVAETRDTHDGGSEQDLKRYREYLKRLTRAAEKEKITPQIVEIAEEITELPVNTPEVQKLTLPKPVIDYSALIKEIERINQYIMEQELKLRSELDDEFAILLMI